MPESQEKESQERLDKIITLIMEEARSVKHLDMALCIHIVITKINSRVTEIMRVMRE